jgi:hypothetical protein
MRRLVVIGVLTAAVVSVGGIPSEGGTVDGYEPGIVGQISDFCVEKFPDHFTGLVLDQGEPVVYRLPGSNLDERVRSQFPHTSVRFRDADYSLQQLLQVHQRVLSDWQAKRIEATGVGLNEDRVVISVQPGHAGRARPALVERYGPMIVVEERPEGVFLPGPPLR